MDSIFLQISFQEFKTRLLEPGLVSHIVVDGHSVAHVYTITPSEHKIETGEEIFHGPGDTYPGGNVARDRYYFKIGNIMSFEQKLEEAQEALNINPHNYVPVTYSTDVDWAEGIMTLAPTLLLLGYFLLMKQRASGGSVGGGFGGKGGRGIFNMGKAPITKLDKNSKNKVLVSAYLYFKIGLELR